MWKRIIHFFTHKPHREKVNVNHPAYLEKNLVRVKKETSLTPVENANTLL
jgi:beta-galactosidase beta subunit